MLTFIRVRNLFVAVWVHLVFQYSVFDVELFCIEKINFTYFSLPMLLTGILSALLGLNINIKGISGGGTQAKFMKASS